MIYDTLERMETYFKKGSPLHKALSYAIAFDPAVPDGRTEIDADRLYALVSSYVTQPAAERRFEAHRKYIDVQIVLDGEERIDSSLEQDLGPLQEYNETKDVIFLEPPADFASLVMRPGTFAVFFPHDVHRPNCSVREARNVRKIVLKVRVE